MKRRKLFTSVALLPLALIACEHTASNRLSICVSILPMKYFVERIGGDRVSVAVMVGPGQNPATYDPLPGQMIALSHTDIFFRIGVPFEDAWITTLKKNYPSLSIIDTRKDIELQPMDTSILLLDHDITDTTIPDDHTSHDHSNALDPHIWLSPELVKIQAKTICDALCSHEPASADMFRANLTSFISDLNQLHDDIVTILQPLQYRGMLVFHPSWGYFAHEFGLKQIPIEIEGKEPGPRELSSFILFARDAGIRVIFTQVQFSANTAQAVAEAIDGAVVPIDPLAEDYINNLRDAAGIIATAIGGDMDGR